MARDNRVLKVQASHSGNATQGQILGFRYHVDRILKISPRAYIHSKDFQELIFELVIN